MKIWNERETFDAIPFTIEYKGIELDFELGAKDWWCVGDTAYELIVDNMQKWGLQDLSEEDFEEVVLDFKVILRDDWYRINEFFLDIYFATDYEEDEYVAYIFDKGTYTLRYINETLSKD